MIFEMNDLPPEIIDEILSQIDEQPHLLSFGLASRACAHLAIPQHTQYRVIRIRTPSPALWAHLVRRSDLARNVREVRLCARDDFLAPDRFPHTLLDPVLDDAHAVTSRAQNMYQALKAMKRLRLFAWDHEMDVKAGLRVDHEMEDLVLCAVVRAPYLEHLSLGGQCAVHVQSGMGVRQIAYPVWQMSGLKSLSLLGAGWVINSNAPYVVSMLQQSPDIEFLEVPMELCGLELCHFPRLKKLRVAMVAGVSGTWSDEAMTAFLENHPTLEELHWLPIDSIRFSSTALPSLKRLRADRRVFDALEETEVVRRIECLDIFPCAFFPGDIAGMRNIDPSFLRRLRFCVVNRDTLYAIAERFTGITWLSLPKVHFIGIPIELSDWLDILSRFPNLEVFRGDVLWSAVEYNKERMHEVIWELINRCPKLQELDHCKYYQKRSAYNVIKIIREENEEGILRVRYEVRKPPPWNALDTISGIFD
ncbi:hypothetical protein D9615_002199 [Tricholomella constricta]|uniref:F-box domain-containing protein n=1 Tax=Tricholomella constricta TaxID=117010 RepID=A0A8H5HLY5_9AGAR|nr:hypothetical protein D9615_002199 [Tricholomella constricta]